MVNVASPIRCTQRRFSATEVTIPQEYLWTDRPTPLRVWGVFDWVGTTLNQAAQHYEQLFDDSLRRIQLSRADDLIGHETRADRFLFLGLPEICGKKLSVDALQEPPFPGWPRVVISEKARSLPCVADCGKRSWYFMRTGEDNWYLDNHHFPKLRNVVQCAILQYLKSGVRIPSESSETRYICARDDKHNSTTLTVGFKGEDLHVDLFTETDGRHGF